MQGVWGAQIKIITYFVTDELRLLIIQILIVDVVNCLKIVRNRRKTVRNRHAWLQIGAILAATRGTLRVTLAALQSDTLQVSLGTFWAPIW